MIEWHIRIQSIDTNVFQQANNYLYCLWNFLICKTIKWNNLFLYNGNLDTLGGELAIQLCFRAHYKFGGVVRL